MIAIEKDSTNVVGLQVMELAINQEYLFVFRQLQTQVVTKTYLVPTSTTDKYTRFEIVDPTDIDLEIGEYEYIVYDGDGISTNENEFLTLEIGKMIVE